MSPSQTSPSPDSPDRSPQTDRSASSSSTPPAQGEQQPRARAAVTAGTAPATASAHPGASASSGRRGVVLGLLTTLGAAAVGALSARGQGRSDSTQPSSGNTVHAQVSVEGMRFSPSTLHVATGDRLVVTLKNTGDQVHDLVFENGTTTGRISAGDSASVDVGVVTKSMQGWCSIAGHRAAGMVLSVEVGVQASTGAASANTDHTGHVGAGSSSGVDVDLQAPLPEDFTPFDAALAPASDSTTHAVTMTVTEVNQDYVGAGVRQTRWTYNGTTPGPVLRGRVGDTFDITLVNQGSMSHSIDFHASLTAPDEVMRSIDPGQSLEYRFTAQHSGIWLYHCSTTPMSVHLASGMFGAVIIDPEGLAPVDREFLLVQSELYPGQDGTTDASKVSTKSPDLMCFNGVAFQYVHQPLQARAGERVRFWVLDAGPSLPSSFHIVGLQFDTVFFEGNYLLGGPQELGSSWHGGSQALALGPAQGGFVEAVIPAAGHYPVVTHAFADMEKGAKAILEAH